VYIAPPPQPKRTAAVAFEADEFGDLPEVNLEDVAMIEAAHATAVPAAAHSLPPAHIQVAILAATLSVSSQPRVANSNVGSSL